MKTKILLSLIMIASLQPVCAKANSLIKDLDSLGSNKPFAERAKALDAENRVRIVQNRTVDRTHRLEIGMSYDGVTGGDSYVATNNLGFVADFHINPKISIGARYYDANSRLTPEGERVFNEASKRQAAGDFNTLRPDIDSPRSSTLGVITVYPLYGKLNFFNLGVTQFDLYALGGYGQMKLNSGSSDTWVGGGGVGVWWSQHFTSRLEARYQQYKDTIYSGSRDQEIVTFSIGLGILL